VDPAVGFDLFALLDIVPSRDEIFVFRIGGCSVAGQLFTIIQVPERICEIDSCRLRWPGL